MRVIAHMLGGWRTMRTGGDQIDERSSDVILMNNRAPASSMSAQPWSGAYHSR